MPSSRLRSPSPSGPSKRQKLSENVQEQFTNNLFEPLNLRNLETEYRDSKPYKHVVLKQLFQDDLLEKVKDECIKELAFTEKETDIYKVLQTGDLASLNFLDEDQRSRLPSLLTLRNALYSSEFRAFLRSVTGCGPLSGSKQDMSVNSYRKGCHLLNHDDVIDTRRVSYILYMPISGEAPGEHDWKKEWGGSLELYDVVDTNGVKEPTCIPSKSIPPSWNQFVFFEVQPGHSFHSVEEVVVGGPEDAVKQRLSISGWFHKPQLGEEGYEPDSEDREKSSLEQLSSSSSATTFSAYSPTELLPDTPLTEDQISYLSQYLNPTYLTPGSISQLCERFAQESNIILKDFLCEPLAAKLKEGLHASDEGDQYAGPSKSIIPAHTSGITESWKLKGPPHKSRYCVLDANADQPETSLKSTADVVSILAELTQKLFPSEAFRAWLALVSSLIPRRHAIEARRFRPGLDYTLATSEDSESRLDVVLGLTPQDKNGMWESGEWGGWECYMAPHDGEDDPAVYGSGSKKTTNGNLTTEENGAAEDQSSDDEDDGTLLTVPPDFNQLLLVLRDERVLRFVKYTSAAAEGSRWDICGEYEVDMIEEEADEDENTTADAS